MPLLYADIPPPYRTQTVSLTGRAVETMQHETDNQIKRSITFGKKSSDLNNELIEIYEETRSYDWDGHESEPLSEGAFWKASAFVKALPQFVPTPELAPTSFNEIDFDWNFGSRKTLNISITENDVLIYAYMIGDEKAHGSMPFEGELPPTLVDFFRRIHA